MSTSLRLSIGELATAFLVFFLMAAAVLGANPARNETVGPFDLLVSQPGWGSQIDFGRVRNAERSDVLDYYLPRWIEARKQLHAGHLPLWNPLPAGGEPGILNLASGELTPGFLIFAASPNVHLGLQGAVLFNLAFCATGIYAFMRRHGDMAAAAFAALTVMLCGFNAAWLYWPHVSTAMWIGWLIWGMDRAMRPSVRHGVAGLALPMAGLLLGGFPFIALLGAGTAALYVLCALAVDPARRQLVLARRVGLALLVSLGLALPGLLGFVEWLKEFELRARVTGSLLSYLDAARLLPHAARRQPGVESGMFAGSVGLLLAALAVIALWASMVKRRQPEVLTVFSVTLLVVAAVLVFEPLPRFLLDWIPGFANNRWNRATCILDIAVALAAGSIIQYLWVTLRRRFALPVVAALLVVQAADLATYFRSINGPVPIHTYYPASPLLDKVIADNRPFQSTVADDSFLVSGTLGAYGIAEWFGHGFRTEALKNVLADITAGGMTTATASRIDASTLRMDSPMLSALGVRYVIGGESLVSFSAPLPFAATKVERTPMPAMPANTLVQYFRLPVPVVAEGISLSLATYGRRLTRGELQVELEDAQGGLLARWRLSAADIVDNQLRSFLMAAPIALSKGHYVVTIRYVGASADDMLTVWSFPGQWNGCHTIANSQPVPACMDVAIRVRRGDLERFRLVASAGGVYLLENQDVPQGAYFLPSLASRPHAASSELVHWTGDGSSHFFLRYTGPLKGWVVVPMSWRSGWRAIRNGAVVHPRSYLDVMPAVPVVGPAEIEFTYRPLGLLVGVPVALLTLVAMMIGTCITNRGAHRRA